MRTSVDVPSCVVHDIEAQKQRQKNFEYTGVDLPCGGFADYPHAAAAVKPTAIMTQQGKDGVEREEKVIHGAGVHLRWGSGRGKGAQASKSCAM